MRNDVKLGFAIGGILLAVLIVYVLVVPGGSNTKQTKLDLNSKKSDGSKVTLEPVPATQAVVPPAPAGVFTPGSTSVEPSAQPSEVAANNLGDKAVDPAPPSKSKDIDWNKLLNGQTLMTSTPEPVGNSHGMAKTALNEPKVTPPLEPETKYSATNPPPAVIGDQTPMDQPTVQTTSNTTPNTATSGTFTGGTSMGGTLSSPSTRPSAITAGRTHIVQANETLSSISAAAYGSSNYWQAIAKANPTLDPNRMKVGTTVILPELKTVKAGDAQLASGKVAGAAPAAAINPAKQYRVQSGDSMYKISVKLYGNSSMAGKIYDTNKQMIGDDPAKVKVGQVLTLPEPPTVATIR